MSEVKPELKQCSRCHSTCALEHFEKNRKGEWFKLCNNCRSSKREGNKRYRDNNKDKIQQSRKTHYENNKDEILEKQKNTRDELREKMFQEHPERRAIYNMYQEKHKRFMELKKAYEEEHALET